MVYVNAILVLAAVRQLCNSCATVVQQLCNTSICTSVAQHLTCATPGLEQVLCMFNTSRALFHVEPGTLMRTHFIVTFEKISDIHKKCFFFGCFCRNFVTPISTLANNKRSCSKSGKFQTKILRFFCFSGGENFSTICHAVLDFREHQGPPSDLFNHARLIAIENQNRR